MHAPTAVVRLLEVAISGQIKLQLPAMLCTCPTVLSQSLSLSSFLTGSIGMVVQCLSGTTKAGV